MGQFDGRRETTLTALLLSEDPAFTEGPLETPTGKLQFLLLLGVEAEVRERALATGSATVLREWRDRDSRLVTRRP